MYEFAYHSLLRSHLLFLSLNSNVHTIYYIETSRQLIPTYEKLLNLVYTLIASVLYIVLFGQALSIVYISINITYNRTHANSWFWSLFLLRLCYSKCLHSLLCHRLYSYLLLKYSGLALFLNTLITNQLKTIVRHACILFIV